MNAPDEPAGAERRGRVPEAPCNLLMPAALGVERVAEASRLRAVHP